MERSPAGETVNIGGLALPWKPAVAIIISTLLLTFDWYYNFAARIVAADTFAGRLRLKGYDSLTLYLLIPLAIIILVYREKPADYGFRLGDWRVGLKWTAIICAVAAPILWWAGHSPAMADYYLRYAAGPGDVLLTAALDLFGWEFFFRGFLLWALYRVAGPSAVLLQAVPFALAHLSKPPLETLSTIFGGTLFGWLAWRTKSFVYPFLVHWFIMSFTVLVAAGIG